MTSHWQVIKRRPLYTTGNHITWTLYTLNIYSTFTYIKVHLNRTPFSTWSLPRAQRRKDRTLTPWRALSSRKQCKCLLRTTTDLSTLPPSWKHVCRYGNTRDIPECWLSPEICGSNEERRRQSERSLPRTPSISLARERKCHCCRSFLVADRQTMFVDRGHFLMIANFASFRNAFVLFRLL